ncbi:hypothetical protein BDV37DRAFT_235972 [Aspergillus pseudonomiae]|uniref:Uncharacterized protein n=1 Tax=Aspergillus pseudonomiae TaxID=1506151 RepID=A0A5N7DVD8_9EURO|nr:uncharacterized protein BDV37DRAFT_235972 [Aspergillus pseudonomiae]KAE8409468.1 hypothetical protein BDV37DRAFT_235972 [Aspergillus pseudonomiae]
MEQNRSLREYIRILGMCLGRFEYRRLTILRTLSVGVSVLQIYLLVARSQSTSPYH